MGKKVVIISTSLRKNSNSDALAREFMRGAQEAGNEVEYVSLRGRKSPLHRLHELCQDRRVCHPR